MNRHLEADKTARWFGQGVIIVGAVLAFATALFYTYRWKVAPTYSYAGLTYREPEPLYYGCAILIVCLLAWFMPRSIRRVSDFILWAFFVRGVVPAILLAQYSQTLPPGQALVMGGAIGLCVAAVLLIVHLAPRRPLPLPRLQTGIDFWVILGVAAFLMYGYLLVTTGLRLQFVALTDVYDVRSDFSASTSGHALVGYITGLLSNVINPIFIARGIYSRKWTFLGVGIFGQLLLYANAGHKGDLFLIVALAGIAILFRLFSRPPAVLVIGGMAAASGFALLLDRITGGALWTSLVSRRFMIVPGALVAAYVAIFSQKPKQHFAEILPFVDNPYEHGVRPVNIVGDLFVGSADTAANVSLFGHGFLNLGYPGMLVESLVLALLVVLANSASKGLPLAVACLIFFPASMTLVSASVFTAILTHGFLAAIIISALAPSRGWGRGHRTRASKSGSAVDPV